MNDSGIGSLFGLDKDECPEGTVPILRTTNEDDEKSLLNDDILLQGSSGVHVRYLIQCWFFICINYITFSF